MSDKDLVKVSRIERAIHVIRDQQVMLDGDLAALYGVRTHRLNEQVRRNRRKFPLHIMFRLTQKDVTGLRSQNAISKRGGRRYLPWAFTETGAVMAATVLNTSLAIEMCLEVVSAFVRMRTILATHRELAQRLEELERKYETHDAHFKAVFAAIRKVLAPAMPPRRRIGFKPSDE